MGPWQQQQQLARALLCFNNTYDNVPEMCTVAVDTLAPSQPSR